jgi:hypothetical protein
VNRPEPAKGISERWELLGEVGVDGASMGLVDPTYLACEPFPTDCQPIPEGSHGAPWSQGGVWFHPGLGDGGYEVWGRIVDYGPDHGLGERVAEIRVVMVSDADVAEWRQW